MSPMRKRKSHNKGLLNAKTKWVVIVGALVCIVAIAVISLSGTGNFQPISYVPRDVTQLVTGQDKLENPAAGQESGSIASDNYNWLLYGTNWHPHENSISTNPELSDEEKLALIETKYRLYFSNLRNAYQGELNRLVESAKGDYAAAKSDRKDISLSRLAIEYINAGRNLEKEADKSFNNILDEMRSELKANELPVNLAREAEKEYQEQKKILRKDMMQQVARYVND